MKFSEEKSVFLSEQVTPHVPRDAECIEAPCPVFDRCGGCMLQHYAYDDQLRIKANALRFALKRHEVTAPEDRVEVLGCENPWAYRNKADFNSRTFDGAIHLGFVPIGGRHIIELESCPICLPPICEGLEAVRAVVNDFPELKHKLISVVVRSTVENGRSVVMFHSKLKKPELYLELGKAVMERCPSVQGALYVCRRKLHLVGEEALEERILDKVFSYSPRAFFQVNPRQTGTLVRTALDALDPREDDVLFDIYSGVGLFAIHAAAKVREVYAIEDTRLAVDFAKVNADRAGFPGLHLLRGQAEEKIELLHQTGIQPTAVLLDPPRSGCHPSLLDRLLSWTPGPRIVMVSCNPVTFARDLARLVEGGYRIEFLRGVDMFPQTIHLECVAMLRKAA